VQRRRSTRARAGLSAGSFPLQCHLQRRHIENCFEVLKSVFKVEPSPQGVEAAISELVYCKKKKDSGKKSRKKGRGGMWTSWWLVATQCSDLSGEKCPGNEEHLGFILD
jgi:hypothetical protein